MDNVRQYQLMFFNVFRVQNKKYQKIIVKNLSINSQIQSLFFFMGKIKENLIIYILCDSDFEVKNDLNKCYYLDIQN